MTDIFEATIVCPKCNKVAEKGYVVRDGFKIRVLECKGCNNRWYHPGDLKDFEEFNKLKNKEFFVKLRMVGNSYAISIPREIIEFEEEFTKMKKEMERKFEQMVRLCFEEPGKLSLFFLNDEKGHLGKDKKEVKKKIKIK